MSEQRKNLKLVTEVEKYPCLYNPELPSYSRKDITEEAWSLIAQAVDLPVYTCKEKWKNLRVVFMRCHKAVSISGQKRKPYYLYDVMQFLVPHLKHNPLPEPSENQSTLDAKETEDDKESNEPKNEPIVEIKHEIEESSNDSYQGEPYNKKKCLNGNVLNYQDVNVQFERPGEQIVSELNNPVVAFLNSILPELNEMNSEQFKMFKRRSLALIDNIKRDDY